MNQALIHGQLSLSYPDGFREMGREEMKALYQDDSPGRPGRGEGCGKDYGETAKARHEGPRLPVRRLFPDRAVRAGGPRLPVFLSGGGGHPGSGDPGPEAEEHLLHHLLLRQGGAGPGQPAGL